MENAAKTRILVVEDDRSVLSTIATMLNLKGYEVETASDGFDALMHLKDNIPDLIVSDLNMPQMSGFELLSVVRRRYPQIKVIATSGAYDASDVPSGVISDGFYPKGRSSAAELLDLIKEVLKAPASHSAKTAPVWIPRNGRDHNGKPFVVLTCTECLRSFPFSVEGEPTAEIQKTPCIYCPHEVSYIIDFSRSVDSPQKRVAWRASFLKSMGKDSAQEVIDASTLKEVKNVMDEPRETGSVRKALNA
jgi:CheY-like chemotaxis protein